MIRQALEHLPGIGPRRAHLFREAGIDSWQAILEQPAPVIMGKRQWERLLGAAQESETAFLANDLRYLVGRLKRADHWRILAHYYDRASYFDIETSGLDYTSFVTMIACYHRDRLYTFVRGRNLEEFLDLLDDVELLVSYCGTTFDVPRILGEFHIPDLPCPHIDLRWVCHHERLRGGLKHIETCLGIRRPQSLQGVDGLEAVRLWYRWEGSRDRAALQRLEQYCAADALSLKLVCARLMEGKGCQVGACIPDNVWQDRCSGVHESSSDPDESPPPVQFLSPLERRLYDRWQLVKERSFGNTPDRVLGR